MDTALFERLVLEREAWLDAVVRDGDSIAAELERCRADVVYWVDRYCWTYDPREVNPILPFVLFPRQAEFLRWLAQRDALQECGLAEKSRDVGFTWLCAAYALHCWLFRLADSTGFGSRKLDLVDHRNNPDCIFEKVRFLLRHLPCWMMPGGFAFTKHDRLCTLLNPENGSTITGEGGSEIGRGGRKSRYFVDEAAFLQNPKSVEAALSQTTRVRIDISTPNGQGNPFHLKRVGGGVPVFTFHWRDDPRKDDAWYAREKARIADPVIIAQELDIDYTASVENVCIPAAWVQSAVGFALPISGLVTGGYRAADGSGGHALALRHGPVVLDVTGWRTRDMLACADVVMDRLEESGAAALHYDCVGVGGQMRALLEMASRQRGSGLGFAARAINMSEAATELRWPDGLMSRDRFRNLRSELFWQLRQRFEKTHAVVTGAAVVGRHAQGAGGLAVYAPEELISIPDHRELIAQISLAVYSHTETGKVVVESARDLRRRGIGSMEYAEALALAFYGAACATPEHSEKPPHEYRHYSEFWREMDNW